MTRNMKTGDMKPFFLKIREEDIIWKDQVATRDDIVDNQITLDGWEYETHTYLNRVIMNTRMAMPVFTYDSQRRAYATITLPLSVNVDTAAVFINKYSDEIRVLENCNLEGHLINENTTTNLSNTLELILSSANGELTETNLVTMSGILSIFIKGFSE